MYTGFLMAMQDNFTTEFFAGNRRRLLEAAGSKAPLVMAANGLLQRNGDNTYKYRQDSSFWYLTGIAEPDIILVMDEGKEYLILPERDVVREVFDGTVTAGMLSARSGIDTVLGTDDGWKRLAKRLKRTKQVATAAAGPEYAELFGLYTNPSRAALARKMEELGGSPEIVDVRQDLMRLRSVKQPVEIEAIQRAVDVTIDGLLHVTDRKRLLEYGYEYELEADLIREFRRQGCNQAFDSIVASGQRACQMHYQSNDGKLAAGELIVFDVGAEYSLYAADVARTVAYGEPTGRQRQVYQAVCEVQDFAYSMLKPGTVNIDYEKEVEKFMGEKLRELGVIKEYSHEAVRKHFPHATTHFLGLDAHDVGDYRQPMQPDMVMVCEPGIYIPEEGIGIRIEDDVIITADGHRVMSSRMPRSIM